MRGLETVDAEYALLCDVNAEGHSVISIALHANKQRMRGH
jgi:hypothetical protein